MKKAFTMVELVVIIAVIVIFTGMAAFGMTRGREDEGLKSDYLEFYDDVKNLQMRANLGKQYNNSSVQIVQFTLPSASSYIVNGVSKQFKNGSKIMKIIGGNPYETGTFIIKFYPNNYSSSGITPTPIMYIYNNSDYTKPSTWTNVVIYIGKTGQTTGYAINLKGAGIEINSINSVGKTTIPTTIP